MTWKKFLEDRVDSTGYHAYFADKYQSFLYQISKRLQNGDVVLKEEGCGIGSTTRCLSEYSYTVGKAIFSDIDQSVLDLCRQNTNYLPDAYLKEDIMSTRKVYHNKTVVVTHGVLEHIDPLNVQKIIDRYNKNPHIISHIHYVPTDVYKKPSFGDERLYPYSQWLLLYPSSYILDNGGKDLYLIFDK